MTTSRSRWVSAAGRKLFGAVAAFTVFPAAVGVAQSELLPPGIGAAYYGYRHHMGAGTYHDRDGDRQPAGERFSTDLRGPSLLAGKAGGELQSLAAALQGLQLQGREDLSEELTLGRLEADVDATVDAHVFGGAYGLNRRLTLFGAVPYIKAAVDTELMVTGRNNAAEIRDELGDLAFAELRAGLDRAAALDAAALRQLIADKGYQPVGRWEAEGFGDVRLGAATARRWRVGTRRTALGARLTAILPTGQTDDPDALTDLAFGSGAYGLGLGLSPGLVVPVNRHGRAVVGGLLYGQWNAPHEKEVRLPEDDELLVDADRRTTVDVEPGGETRLEVRAGWDFGLIDVQHGLGRRASYGDRYSGGTAGNYAALGEGSDSSEIYGKTRVRVDTTGRWRRHRRGLPVHVTLTHHKPWRQTNSYDNESIELGLTGFLAGPPRRR